MKSRLFFVILLSLYLILTFTSTHADDYIEEEIIEQTLAFSPGDELLLKAVNGDIQIKTWNKEKVHIYAHKKAKAHSEEEALELLEIVTVEIDSKPGHLKIWTHHPKNFKMRKKSINISYTLTVPQKIHLDLQSVNGNIDVPATSGSVETGTVNGNIDVSETHGAVKSETVNGKIHLIAIVGSVQAQTVNGTIDIDIQSVDEDGIQAQTVNGKINLSLPSDIRAKLRASTQNGNIQTDFPLTVRGWIGKTAKGQINGGGPSISLQTLNGGIRLKQR
ncbi:MAG: DUF4097 family beta strand repeat-containing protein [bacterium]|nr:DUF4097 family beta strand repeat-containing protein [bacterium]